MSEKATSRSHRQLSISIPPTLMSSSIGPERSSGDAESSGKTEIAPKAERTRPEELPADEKLTRQKLQTALPGTSLVSTPGTASTPNAHTGPNTSVTSVEQPSATGPSVINKQLLSKLNKSLKEKLKVIQTKESHTKNPMLIQDILTTPPLQTAFVHNPTNLSATPVNEAGRPNSPTLETNNDERPHDADVGGPSAVVPKEPEPKTKAKSKRIAKQNSTRTDFFAAKLASAVDDVSSSNSDETFVYENNVIDFEGGTNLGSQSGRTGGISGLGGATAGDETSSPVDNINHVPPSIHFVNDNISAAGSIRNATPLESTINSPIIESRREREDEPAKIDQSRAESIHSIQSAKWNLRNTFSVNTTPLSTSNGRSLNPSNLLHVENTTQFLNPYFDGLMRDASNKAARRESSSNSLVSEDKSYDLRSPVLHYSDPNHTLVAQPSTYGINVLLPNAQSINEGYHEGNYSFDVEDDEELSGDAVSSRADLNLIGGDSNLNNINTSPNDGILKTDQLTSGKHQHKKSKASTTSSKLRSTTSKLFDKKGAQPRRYSIIPDDIDIEDFDDELIYYDNKNIRFPYNSQSGNESASLLGGSHRLPHYRSLNLNFNGKRQPNKRYTSIGYVPPGAPANQNGNKNNDIFPFPYPEPNQKYYYDFDEYDEDAQADGRDEVKAKGMPGRNRLSPTNTHFFLPRKVSHDNFGDNKIKFFKSFVYTLISIICILAIGFILGFVLASTKDLTNISIVSIDNAVVTQDELVFSIVVEALNPGWFTVIIEEVEIDIFAKSGYLDQPGGLSVETVLLGSVFNLESALVFEGSLLNRELRQQTGDIKLIGPGKNLTGSNDPPKSFMGHKLRTLGKSHPDPDIPDNADKWKVISKHPFDLILRGVFKYSLPMTSNTKSAVINKVGYVDPSTAVLPAT